MSKEVESSKVDESFIYKVARKFIRIEYPGVVKNCATALETLGGIYNIEMAFVDSKRKLELKFHPLNKYNKPCYADKDSSPGLFIKIKKINSQYSYEIIGYTFENFTFNKAADFQYLPVVQDESGNPEYVYNRILPNKLPNLDFLISKENATQPLFALPVFLSRFETSHNTLYLRAGEKFNLDLNIRPELFKMFEKKPNRERSQYRQISYLLNINDPNLEIPKCPKELVKKMVKAKLLDDYNKELKKMFQERPMWTKANIQHKTGITDEMLKVLLPANAYYWCTGPWRTTWTVYNYDPTQNFSSRIYQTLDFRIRAKGGNTIKVLAKRNTTKSKSSITSPNTINESHYILSPDLIPPARQMFYQYCDIQIPEIQDMLQRLPKTQGSQKFDIKNGWLPINFSEQCRELASRYITERVRQELAEDSMRSQSEKNLEKDSEDDIEQENPLNYSSRMLNQMQKGFRRTLVPETSGTVILTDDEDDDDGIDQVVLEESLERAIDDNSDVDQYSDESEMELDMEAVEEINQLISETKNVLDQDLK